MVPRVVLLALAAAAAVVPLPARLVEAWYTDRLYSALQPVVTTLSNQVPFALFDLLLVGLLAWGAWIAARFARGPRKGGRLRLAARVATQAAVLAAAAYLAFLLIWGLNYRRVPLESRVDFSRSRVTAAAARSVAVRLVARLNMLRPELPRDGWGSWSDTASALTGPFSRVERQLGSRWNAVPGVPKWSVLSWYFERAAVDGMTDPFFLEVLVNRSLLPFERPAVLAHEWAHLAGYSVESEASFVGWLTCLQGPPAVEYSGHLSLAWQLLARMPAADREPLTRQLHPAVRDDLRAIARRLAASSPQVRDAAWRVYDGYLKANRVDEGVRSYGEALDLLLGTRFNDAWVPALAPSSPKS